MGLLGLALRAGQVTHGDALCEREARAGRAAVMLLDSGVSGNTREKYAALCGSRSIPLRFLPEDALGAAIGKPGRMTACVKRGALAEKLLTLLGSEADREEP